MKKHPFLNKMFHNDDDSLYTFYDGAWNKHTGNFDGPEVYKIMLWTHDNVDDLLEEYLHEQVVCGVTASDEYVANLREVCATNPAWAWCRRRAGSEEYEVNLWYDRCERNILLLYSAIQETIAHEYAHMLVPERGEGVLASEACAVACQRALAVSAKFADAIIVSEVIGAAEEEAMTQRLAALALSKDKKDLGEAFGLLLAKYISARR